MQSAASRRAFSALASKIHPQLPLSPRESQQLLNLLTTSFKAHLDREHPVPNPQEPGHAQTQRAVVRRVPTSSGRAPSSYSSAAQHIDSILTNPVIARKPRRRGSESAALDILKDPLGWFLDQVAIGTASLREAAMCLDVLNRPSISTGERKPGSVIAQWLESSGRDMSDDFLNVLASKKGISDGFMYTLVAMLLAEGNQAPLWRWFSRPTEHWKQETSKDPTRIDTFRAKLLRDMVIRSQTRDEALTIYLRAYQMQPVSEDGLSRKIILPAGGRLVNSIVSNPQLSSSPQLYELFITSTDGAFGDWSKVVQPMLWLFHPTKPTARPGLDFISDPQGAAQFVACKRARQHFLVQMCLGVARQLLEEERFSDAQIAMNFAKEHFPEIVLHNSTPVSHSSERRTNQWNEKENLEMLDRLLPT